MVIKKQLEENKLLCWYFHEKRSELLLVCDYFDKPFLKQQIFFLQILLYLIYWGLNWNSNSSNT